MRIDTSIYSIKVIYDEEYEEYKARWNMPKCQTYGVGETKAEAIVNLIENSTNEELEQ